MFKIAGTVRSGDLEGHTSKLISLKTFPAINPNTVWLYVRLHHFAENKLFLVSSFVVRDVIS